MLKVTVGRPDAAEGKVDMLAVGVFAGGRPGPGCEEVAAQLGTPLAPLLKSRGFSGKAGEVLAVPTLGRMPATTVLLVGLGERGAFDAESLRRATSAIVRNAGGAKKAAATLLQALTDPEAAVRASVEGAMLAAYRFDKYKASANGAAQGLAGLVLVPAAGWQRAALTRAAAAGQVRAAATNLARDLSNEPANKLHPEDLAAAARRAMDGTAVTVKVKDEKALRREGFGGIVGVGQGAADPPRLVQLDYAPAGARGRIILVGKGITFDSGGLSLKPSDSMGTMKTDMSGAAAVIGVMSALQALDVKVAVTGYLASAENMPSGAAIRPGDVLTMRNGKTVEVLNTDAEGRLVMADALAYGAESKPDAMVDIATLTGACVVALGLRYTGLMTNDQALGGELLAAAEQAGEPTWELPLPDAYRKDIDSEVADLKNIGGSRWGGALTAGLFLKEFVDGLPWAHLDIAGPSRAESDDAYIAKGSTGAAVRTLLTWLERRGAERY